MGDLFDAIVMLAAIMLPVLIVLLLICIGVWVLCCVFYMKFCSACGHAHAGLVWVPLPGVPNIVILESMAMTGAVNYSSRVVYGVCGGMLVGILLAGIQYVGWLFSIIASICSIAYMVLALMGIYKVAEMVGKNAVLYLVLALVVPISQPFLYGNLAKGITEYADSAYN